MVRPLLRLWRCRDVILWRLFRGFDIRTKEHNLCVPLRLCVRFLFAGTARTLVGTFFTQRRKVSQSICGVKFLFAMRGEGRRHDMTSLRVLEISPGISFCFTQRRKVPQSICGVKFLFAMRGEGRRHDMTSLRVLEI